MKISSVPLCPSTNPPLITPILKSGNPSIISNYRPISILSHISKLFESLVLKGIQPVINNLILEKQHGFRSGRSTTTCNLVFSNHVQNSFEQNSQVDVTYTDFSKSFWLWFQSYLSDWLQDVSKIFEIRSNKFLVTLDVPQGGYFSPLLFSLFIKWYKV